MTEPAPASTTSPGTARLGLALFASVTLGLAPFAPEPHVVGKLRWLLGGGAGMTPMDGLDLAFHGAPWVWLVLELVRFSWLWFRRSQAGGRSASS